MKHPLKKAAAFLLAAALLVQGLPLTAFAAQTSQGFSPGKELFVGEEGQTRQYVSETAYDLAPGVTEYVTYTNVKDGTNQNIDYFCEVDLSQAKIMAGYSGMENILENQTINWRMQTVSDQVKDAQAYFTRAEQYADSTIVAALNADYYNMATGQPTGALIIDGKSYNPVNGRYYFGITEEGKAVISNSADTQGLAYAVGGGTLLVKEGEVNVSKGGRNVTYTAIGIKADGTVVSMVCYGQRYPVSCGYTQYEVAQMMKARGCQTALLLDGSGSSTFVSRREGDSQVITRNNPSDGQERQVSSSIFIVSDVKATGEFDHAVITPVNEVYTPGSTVQFTAVGADPSGAPAPLPENASWSVDSAYGSIGGSTGVFTSNGSLGEVTVSLQSAGETVGEATITIAAPDQLLFSSEKVNVGFGDTSDLGLQVRYQGRNVNYKDGDFQWTLSDEEMGSFSGNLFQASETESITGTATVTSVHDQAVTATVQLEVGKEPIIAMDFEKPNWKIVTGTTQHGLGDVVGVFDENGNYTTDAAAVSAATQGADAYCLSYTNRNGPTQPKVGNAEIVSLAEGAPVHSGSYSMRMDYDFTQNNNQTDGVCFGLSEDLVLEGNPNKIGLWVYIPEGTPSLWLRLRYTDGAGASSQIDFTKEDLNDETGLHKQADNAWHYYEANLENLITPVKIPAGMSIRLMVLSYATSGVGWTSADGTKIDKSECYGSLYFDDLTFIYGSTNQDVVPPEITNVTVNESPLTDGQTFDTNTLAFSADFQDSTETSLFNTGINFDNVLLYVDGLRIEEGAEGAFVDHSGIIRADKLVLSQGQHTIRLLVTDIAGNQASQSYNINITDPQAPAAPVSVTAREGTAVLGQDIHLDFTPASADVTSLEASVFINKAYKDSFELSVPAGCTIAEEARYDSVTSTVSFKVEGSVSSGPMATLAFTVPSSVVPGTTFSGRLTKGVVTFASAQEGLLPTFGGPVVEIPVSAPYTVSSGTLVAGLEDSFVFTITDSSTGSPAPGVDLYLADGTRIGTSDSNGQVRYIPGSGVVSLTVYAQDGENHVSGSYQATVYTPQGREDGAPTHVWRNASDDADSLNVSWLSNPLYADGKALLQLAEEEEAVEGAEPIPGTCQLTGFSDNAAANACGVTAEGLAPGTTYYYRVGDGTHWSAVRSFTTGYENTGIQALVLGDLQESNNQNLSGILEQVGVEGLDLTVQTGDLVDSGGNYAYWDSTLSMLEKLDTDRFFSLGNHELEGGLPIGTLLYHQENPDYTSAEYGNVYFASIAINGGTAGYEKALEWLVADAQASHASWKILVTHQPAYYTNTVAGMDASTQQAIAQAAQEAGIDVVLSGHDHSYARTQPLYNGAVDEEKGITYFICGSLGEKSYGVTNTPEFHFAKATNDYQALYTTLSTTADTLTIQVYDYNSGSPEQIDSFTKTKDNGGHAHAYTWDGASRLVCDACGYTISSANYTGFANYTTPAGDEGQIYLNTGKLMVGHKPESDSDPTPSGVFAVGDELYHPGEDGLIHESETIDTAQCWEDGRLACWCHDCNTIFLSSETKRQGHEYDENHVCTRQVFDMKTYSYHTCGFQAKSIEDMDISLAYKYGFYTGEAKKPAVTVKDPETGKKYFGQSTYGDFMPYWRNNVDVGTATVEVRGYSDGPIYGTATLTFQIVPTNVTEEDFSYTTTTNSVHLSWEPSLGATHYIVYQNIGGTWTRLGIVDKREYTVTGLAQGTYQFRIRPFATVDGQDYYSTKNSDIVTVEVEGGPLSFEQGGAITCAYGDEPFTNAARMDDSTEGFTYSSSDKTVATVNPSTGEVTIVGAGSAVITAKKEDVTGQYRLTVSPIPVGLEWNGMEDRVYDGQPSNVTATATGLLGDDAVQVTVSGGSEKDAGTYTAAAVSLDNRNYALPEGASASYTIIPKPITALNWSDTELTYTGRPLAPTASSKEVVEGDTVEFSVPTVTEPGTYEVAAASKNPNYVVADSAKTCTFTIAYPQVYLDGGEGADLTYSFDGMTILVSGFVPTKSQPVTLELTGNGQSTSAKIYGEEAVSTITLSGVTYTVDVNVTATSVKREDGATQASISAELTEEEKAAVQDAAKSENNRFVDIWGSIAGSFLDKVIREAQEFQEKVEEVGESLYVEIYQKLDVVEYDPGAENPIYKVDITPYYDIYVLEEGQMKPADGAKPILGNALDNEQFQEKAPVQVSLVVPAGITLDNHTYILHEDGTYIKPDKIEGQVLTFTTPHFSQFTVVNDSRQAEIAFTSEEGTVTCIYTPADINKTPLPKSEYGWTIHGKRYTTFEEELFDVEGALQAEPADPPVTPGGTPSEPEEPTWPFTDVTEGDDWFYDAVAYVYENGIMAGTSETTFEPGMLLDRAMAAQLFYNLEGKPAVTGDSTFTDVTSGHWAVDAITWAAQNDIVAGIGGNLYDPDSNVTREQFAVMLYKYARFKGYDLTATGDLTRFPDAGSISSWAETALSWASGKGLINGHENGTIDPKGSTIRAQAASIMANFDQNVAK
ncbi:phosphodiester glycosidase family protein [Acutalibacter sp. LFL-21]|uniref:phosphodiester glycosidase family protein n=1 Tax=Acutalibacter sp. LFL-21 TaxID=2983399 RepID=UPI0021D693EE|nr:phosphodiester glycosidase family protein [Acutalibacter sp. LFL-21]MCU7652506.1 phosphodiester glycosidase family protein [Acutalibacter sp. LFL-21]